MSTDSIKISPPGWEGVKQLVFQNDCQCGIQFGVTFKILIMVQIQLHSHGDPAVLSHIDQGGITVAGEAQLVTVLRQCVELRSTADFGGAQQVQHQRLLRFIQFDLTRAHPGGGDGKLNLGISFREDVSQGKLLLPVEPESADYEGKKGNGNDDFGALFHGGCSFLRGFYPYYPGKRSGSQWM